MQPRIITTSNRPDLEEQGKAALLPGVAAGVTRAVTRKPTSGCGTRRAKPLARLTVKRHVITPTDSLHDP
jgi:hypothetical protein